MLGSLQKLNSPRSWILAIVAVAAAVGFALLGTKTLAQTVVTVTYHYDSLGRIVQDIYPSNSAAYNYDAAGNRVSFTLN